MEEHVSRRLEVLGATVQMSLLAVSVGEEGGVFQTHVKMEEDALRAHMTLDVCVHHSILVTLVD